MPDPADYTLSTAPWAVLLAAGKGSRLAEAAGGPKQFLETDGVPLFWRSVRTFAKTPRLAGIVFVFPPGQLDEARELLEGEFNFCIQDVPEHGCLNGELINRKYDKGRGVLRICEHLGIPVSETIGFGDSMNDREMIETVGISVCMGNGSETLKALSDMVCPGVEDDGLRKAFEELGLL